MKHVVMDSNWKFSMEPFPAFRCSLVYGRNKRDFDFLPVVNEVLSNIIEDNDGNFILKENSFKVIKTKKKGTILIVPNKTREFDEKCLAFIGVSDGFRGDSGLLEDKNCKVLKHIEARNKCEGHTSLAVILKKGEKVVMYSSGRRNNDVITFFWDGENLKKIIMNRKEYEVYKENQIHNDDYEVL